MIVTIERQDNKTNETKISQVNIKIDHNVDETGYNLIAVDNEKHDVLGRLTFHVEQPHNRIWLNSIETNKHNRKQYVGTSLLTAMEYIALHSFRINNILGVFNPKLPSLPITQRRKEKIIKGTKKFYERNNYVVDERHSTLSKTITKPLSEYNKMIDCSYTEMQKFKIDFDAIEEQQNKFYI